MVHVCNGQAKWVTSPAVMSPESTQASCAKLPSARIIHPCQIRSRTMNDRLPRRATSVVLDNDQSTDACSNLLSQVKAQPANFAQWLSLIGFDKIETKISYFSRKIFFSQKKKNCFRSQLVTNSNSFSIYRAVLYTFGQTAANLGVLRGG